MFAWLTSAPHETPNRPSRKETVQTSLHAFQCSAKKLSMNIGMLQDALQFYLNLINFELFGVFQQRHMSPTN